MGRRPKDILGSMTLSEIEEIAKRAESAAKTLRDAMSVMRPVTTQAPRPTVAEAIMHKEIGSILLDTPERREWDAQQAEVAEAIKKEKAPKQLPFKQREAIEKGLMGNMATERSAKLSQFAHDGPPEPNGADETVDKQAVLNLSEAT